jgi:hypothetical protein
MTDPTNNLDPANSENPLQARLAEELANSQWLQKFKAINQLLQIMRSQVPLTQLCELKWLTATDSLVVHCPSVEIWQDLCQQKNNLVQHRGCAQHIVLKHSDCDELDVLNPL